MKVSDYWEDDIELTKRLVNADLSIPDEVMNIINEIGAPGKGERKDQFITFFEMFEGKFLERVIAFRFDNRKNEPLKYMEVSRKIEGQKNKALRNIYSTMAGPHVCWSYERKLNSYWSYYEDKRDDIWYKVSCFNYTLYGYSLQSFQDLIKLDPNIKYCGFDYCNKGMHGFIEYITIFRRFPEVEMYAKKGIYHLVTDSRFYKKMNKSKEFSKYVKDNLEEIKEKQYSYSLILKGFKSGTNLKRFFNRSRLVNSARFIGNESILSEKVIDRIVDTYSDVEMYLDYFNSAKHFIYMDNNNALYPVDLKGAHDYYSELYSKNKKQIKAESFLQAVSKWDWLNWKNKKLCIFVAPAIDSLAIEGQALGHCVGQQNYDQRMAEGGNIILFIRKTNEEGKSFYTMEFDKEKNEVVQCRGEKNCAPTDEVKRFIERWKKQIPRLKQMDLSKTEFVSENGFKLQEVYA